MEKEHIRYYIKTRTILGINALTIHHELVSAYGQDVVSYATVQRWSKDFREGKREQLQDNSRPGRPIAETTNDNIERVRKIIDEDPHSTYNDIIAETSLSYGTVERILHDHLKLRKITSRWVPRELTAEQKQVRVRVCRENLEKFESGSWHLWDLVTGDESYFYLQQLGRKSTNACWIGEDEMPKTVARRSQFAPKFLFCIFFKSNGPLVLHGLDKGKTLDYQCYIENCLKPLVEQIKRVRKSSGTAGVKLLHDNARPHQHNKVSTFLREEGIKVMPHPPYSPDLAPCDFWLFDYIKSNLTDQTDKNSLHNAIADIINNIPENEYKKTFNKLIERMRLCIENKGEYFEHLIK